MDSSSYAKLRTRVDERVSCLRGQREASRSSDLHERYVRKLKQYIGIVADEFGSDSTMSKEVESANKTARQLSELKHLNNYGLLNEIEAQYARVFERFANDPLLWGALPVDIAGVMVAIVPLFGYSDRGRMVREARTKVLRGLFDGEGWRFVNEDAMVELLALSELYGQANNTR